MTNDIRALIERTLELDAEATAGPWTARQVNYEDRGHAIVERVGITAGEHVEDFLFDRRAIFPSGEEPVQPLRDASLIAEYRTLAPLLARECQRLRERVAELERELETAKSWANHD